MSYKFDGKYLKQGGTIIANVNGNQIRKGNGSSIVANIKDDVVRKDASSMALINVSGNDIRLGGGSSKIGTMKDVEKVIDGPGGVTKAALWFLFIK